MKAKDFFNVSSELNSIKGYYITSEKFEKAFNELTDFEQKSLLHHYIIDNAPYLFNEFVKVPLLYEQIKQYLSYELDISMSDVKLIGSAKVGFSISVDSYGKEFSSTSDLDFAVVNKSLFDDLVNDFHNWEYQYKEKKTVKPKNNKEQTCWEDNITGLPKNIDHGFIDSRKLPNLDICATAKKINNSMYCIGISLEKYNATKIKYASVRVYKDDNSFYEQLLRNCKYIMGKRK